ncbi:MAG: MFS transporter [Chloroflexi bacterium]|nr:MFS transporter [Chloroflexota bacterium]
MSQDHVASEATSGNDSRLAPFAALQNRDFRLLWFAQLISQAGTTMQTITINWHIYILTGSALALGLTGLVRVVPIIVFSLVGGIFADAHDRRRLLLATQSAMMIFAALLGVITETGHASVLLIYLLSALTAATVAFDSPARQALVPNLVPREQLTNALSLNNMMSQAAAIIGPALAGFVIAGLSIAAVYWINAVSFLAVLFALLLMRTPSQENLGIARVTPAALREGISFVRHSTIILSTALLDFFATFFSSASALLPIFAQDILHVGPQGLGILYSAESIGAVVAGLGVAFVGNVRHKGVVLLWAIALYGLATALYGASQWFLLSFILLACVGAADTVSTILRNTIRQIATPDYLRGRMTSVMMIFFMGGPQLGELEAGLVAAWLGAPLSVITGGVGTIIAVAIMAWLVPSLRNYRERVEPAGVHASAGQ